jgi:hypothetical protein
MVGSANWFGHVRATPSHLSATSQAPADARQSLPSGFVLVEHALEPLHVRFSHSTSTQVIGVPMQPPVALHLSV